MSWHSSMIKMSHLILLPDISWLVKLVISSLKYNPNAFRDHQFFINISFIWLYTFYGIYFPFLDIIGCNPPCSYKYVLLSFKNCLFFSFLVFLIPNCHKGSLRYFLEAIKAQPRIKVCFTWLFFIILYHSFQILLPQWNTCMNLVTYYLIHSYFFFEISIISYTLLNMVVLFWYWILCNKRLGALCNNNF